MFVAVIVIELSWLVAVIVEPSCSSTNRFHFSLVTDIYFLPTMIIFKIPSTSTEWCGPCVFHDGGPDVLPSDIPYRSLNADQLRTRLKTNIIALSGILHDSEFIAARALLSVLGKVFAHVLLARLDPLLQKHRRPHQSGFTRCRSTLDAILALRLLTEIHREFQQPLHVAFVDLKAAFDSVDRNALWKAMRGIGVPSVLMDLIIDLHTAWLLE